MSGRKNKILGWAAVSALALWAAAAGAETIDMVMYYPASGGSGGGGGAGGGGLQDSQQATLQVGTDYETLPAPNDGVALIADAMAIGVPVPPSGTITPAGALQVVGIPNKPDKVLFSPGAGWGGRMELEVTGNVKLPLTAAAGGTATAGVLFAGTERFLHNYGTDNTFLGEQAGNFTLTGAKNTGLGYKTLFSLTSGNNNTAIGNQALYYLTSGNNNTAAGARALLNNTTGYNNTAVGARALAGNTAGANNTAIGYQALGYNQTGSSNVAIGNMALYSITASNENTVVGAYALSGRDNPGGNTVVGAFAGEHIWGTKNVYLGYEAGRNNWFWNNTLRIDNSNTWTPLIYGDFAANTVVINGQLEVTSMPRVKSSSPYMKWRAPGDNLEFGRDLAELFNCPAGPLPAGTIAALGADGDAVAAAAGTQTLGPTPALPGILMDGSSQKIGPTPEDLNVPGKTAVALLGRVTVQTQGPVQAGDLLVAGPSGKAVRWKPGESALSYVGLVLEVNPKAKLATVLVGHQGLQKVLSSLQDKNRSMRENLNRMKKELEQLKRVGR